MTNWTWIPRQIGLGIIAIAYTTSEEAWCVIPAAQHCETQLLRSFTQYAVPNLTFICNIVRACVSSLLTIAWETPQRHIETTDFLRSSAALVFTVNPADEHQILATTHDAMDQINLDTAPAAL